MTTPSPRGPSARRTSARPPALLVPSPSCPILDPATASGELRDELTAWLRLQAACFLDPAGAAWRLALAGGARAALSRSERERALPSHAVHERIEALCALGVRAVPILSPAYPERLRALPDPAPLLLVRGDPRVLSGRAVAIVGARAATGYGLDVARELAGSLAAAGLVIVSGLARGIDAAAHRAALEVGGLTVAFSACGPEQVYPRQHRELAREIAERGACATEMPPGTPPRAHYFPLRNRLIAGLAEVVVVVEARLRSGSLVTARRALADGREVMAVPGSIYSPTSEGPNALLKDGAAPVRGPEDVLEQLGLGDSGSRAAAALAGAPTGVPMGVPTGVPMGVPTGVRAGVPALARTGARTAALAPSSLALLDALAVAPASRDELCRRLSLAPQRLAVDLFELEMAGLVRLDRDGRLHAVRHR